MRIDYYIKVIVSISLEFFRSENEFNFICNFNSNRMRPSSVIVNILYLVIFLLLTPEV